MQSASKESPVNVIILAVSLCVVCSLVVSAAAIGLRSVQKENISLDRKKNILSVTGFTDLGGRDDILKTFEDRFTVQIIDLETGKPAAEEAAAAMREAGKEVESAEEALTAYDQVWASKSKKDAVADKVPADQDRVQIKFREKFSHVYILRSESGEVERYVFPVRGYGLWSMMKGYLAVKPDLQTVAGLTFYEHAETPGLGGEIKSERFKSQWPGKKIYSEGGDVAIQVVKAAPKDEYSIDALTGATITSNGVSYMMKYWLGPEGFGPYIEQQKAGEQTTMKNSGDNFNG